MTNWIGRSLENEKSAVNMKREGEFTLKSPWLCVWWNINASSITGHWNMEGQSRDAFTDNNIIG